MEYFENKLTRDIQEIKSGLLAKMEFIKNRIAEAERALLDGRSPSSCGIIQSTGNLLDQEVAKLHALETALRDYKEYLK